MDDQLMNDPREIITEVYEDLSMEEVMDQEEYEQCMDEMFDEANTSTVYEYEEDIEDCESNYYGLEEED